MRARVATSFLTAALIAPLVTLGAQNTVDGWRYTMTMTVDSGNGHPHVMTMRHIIADGILRNEISSNAVVGAATFGSYMVVNPRDSTYLTVLPSQRMAMVMSSAMIAGAAPELPTMVVHNDGSSREDLGAGEAILGHATHHYRTTTSGSADATLNGKTCTRSMNGTTEVWIAPDIDATEMHEAEQNAYGQAMRRRIDSLRKSDAPPQTMPKGLVLRTRRTETVTDSAGKQHTIVSTTEYTELDRGPIDRAMFEIPQGYRVMDMRSMAHEINGAVPRRPVPNPFCP